MKPGGGCVYDVDRIIEVLEAGKRAETSRSESPYFAPTRSFEASAHSDITVK